MRVLLINSVCGIKSTGRICTDIASKYISEGHTVKIAYGRDTVPSEFQKLSYKIGNEFDLKFHGLFTRVFDNHGLMSKISTAKFLKWAEEYDPHILWIHNIHGYYINYEMLFKWIKKRPDMQVKWTLHDCWSFTGHCAHFVTAGCEKWKSECYKCPLKTTYPESKIFDNSKGNYRKKKEAFTGVKDMTIIVPSQWLANLVKQSYLKDYPIEVHYNTIDTDVFKPTDSDFKKKYGLEDKKIVLGVASAWGEAKGLYDFYKLAEMLDDIYSIVLVGLKKSQFDVPEKIIVIEHTDSKKELAEIYSSADVFVNPSRQETFGLTTLEAISCGTKAIVYKDTACEEVIEKYGGISVDLADVNQIFDAIKKLCEE